MFIQQKDSLDSVSVICDNICMKYDIETTNFFDKWLDGIKNKQHRARIVRRFDHIQRGNFGDHKNISENLSELRFFFGPGFRAYYTVKNSKTVFLLCGGDKSSQIKDIIKSKAIIAELE